MAHAAETEAAAGRGDLPAAVESHQQAVECFRAIWEEQPQSVEAGRDLVVAAYHFARFAGQHTGDEQAAPLWGLCHATLRAMRERGMELDEGLGDLLRQLDQAVVKEGE